MRNMYAYDGRFQLQAWKQWLIKNVKKKVKKVWKKCGKKSEKMRKMWWTHLEIQLGRWNSDFFFFRCDFSAQLLQVENRRGAVQIDRKWTVQIADLLNLVYSKTMTTRSKNIKSNEEGKENKTSKLF